MKIKTSLEISKESKKQLSLILEEIKKRKLPGFKIRDAEYFAGIGHKMICLNYLNSSVSTIRSNHKSFTSGILQDCKIPTPKHVLLNKNELKNYKDKIRGLKPPFVIKPPGGSLSIGITLGVKTDRQIKEAFKYATERSDEVMIEEFLADMLDYRLTFYKGHYLGALLAIPETVTGNGEKNIKQLITEYNKERKEKYNLPPLTHEWIFKTYLAQYGYDMKSIPPKDKIVRVYGRGGIYKNATRDIHPENIELCRNACQILGLKFAGVDFMSVDASIPYQKNKAVINEINSFPHLDMHEDIVIGEKIPIVKNLVKIIFPEDDDAWIPITIKEKEIKNFEELKKYVKEKPYRVELKDPNRTIKNPPLPLMSYLINNKTTRIKIK